MLGHWFAPASPTWATSGSGAPTCTPDSYGPLGVIARNGHPHTDRVDHLVVPLDADDRLVGQFRQGHFTGTHGGREFFGRSESRFHECAP
ncbi:hypothetical protein [Nonomuraea sp. NPDC003709]|uniref:hypothetical protein n=1 Tax=Nonomuraea sp. NPDC003709 TaxID=3154450 RepID=UPI0033AA9918